MNSVTNEELKAALKSIASMIERSEKAQEKFSQGTSQHTLLRNRIHALRIASSLVLKELPAANAADGHTREDLENARAPIASLIGKSEKAKQKLAPRSWQRTMLEDNLKALYIASSLLANALEEA